MIIIVKIVTVIVTKLMVINIIIIVIKITITVITKITIVIKLMKIVVQKHNPRTYIHSNSDNTQQEV